MRCVRNSFVKLTLLVLVITTVYTAMQLWSGKSVSEAEIGAVAELRAMTVERNNTSVGSPILDHHTSSTQYQPDPTNKTVELYGPSPPSLPREFNPLSPKDIESVEKFVFFVGYPRSGHSIIGSMMDAHPDMVIAHEYSLFNRWAVNPRKHQDRRFLFNQLFKNSYHNAVNGWRSSAENKSKKGYKLEMSHTWQGMFRTLRVIGDKAGGTTSHEYVTSPSKFAQSYRQLVQTVKVPVIAIHVVRNPYDMIATRMLYSDTDRNGAKLTTATVNHKYNNTSHLLYHVRRVFDIAQIVHNMIQDHDLMLTVLEIHNADFILDPKGTLRTMCNYLGVSCLEDYLKVCYDKTYRTLSRTRDLVVWTPKLIEEVSRRIQDFPFFQRYSFESD